MLLLVKCTHFTISLFWRIAFISSPFFHIILIFKWKLRMEIVSNVSHLHRFQLKYFDFFLEKNRRPHDTMNFFTYHRINSCLIQNHSVEYTWKWQRVHGIPLVNSRSKKELRKIQILVIYDHHYHLARIDLRALNSTTKVNKKFTVKKSNGFHQ